MRLFAIGAEDALLAVAHRPQHRDTGRHQPCKSASEKSKDPSFLLERGVFYSRRRDIAEESYRKNQTASACRIWHSISPVHESISSHF
jgi:hypothetical protein